MGKRILVAMTAIMVLALASVVMAADPFVGTWKMNVAKFKSNSWPAPKSAIWKMEVQNNEMKVIWDEMGPRGNVIHAEYSAKYDGKDCPVTGDSHFDTVSVKRIDVYTVDSTYKKNGKVVMNDRIVVSKDGKVMTDTMKGKDANGQDFSVVAILDRQ
jgi:hypothetical protein